MNKKISKNLLSKIGKYSLLAGATVTVLNSCNKDDNDPNIIELDIVPDIALSALINSNATQQIDINGDGVLDIRFEAYNYTYPAYSTDYNTLVSYGLNGAEVLTASETITIGGSTYEVDAAIGLAAGATISPAQAVWKEEGGIGFKGEYYGVAIEAGQFFNVDRYIGIRFQASGNTHYGWIRVRASEDGGTLTIQEYAYHIVPNNAIIAGEI